MRQEISPLSRARRQSAARTSVSPFEPRQTMDEEQHERGNGKEQKFHNCFGSTHGHQFRSSILHSYPARRFMW